MKTFKAVRLLALLAFTGSGCAAVGHRAPVKSPESRRLENSVVARLIVERMDRELSFPKVIGDLRWIVDKAHRRLAAEEDAPDRVQKWMLNQSRRVLPGWQRAWKAEIESVDQLEFPEHMLTQDDLQFAFVAHRRLDGRAVVIILYRNQSGERLSALADETNPNRIRELESRGRLPTEGTVMTWLRRAVSNVEAQ